MAGKTKKTIGNVAKQPAQSTTGKTSAGTDTAQNTETPLEYMLRVMRDPAADETRRDAMAKAVLPYMHARLANVDGQVSENESGTITFTWAPAQQ